MSTNDSPENNDELVIVCQPYAGIADVIPGAQAMRASCGHDVWLSPHGQRFLREHPATKTSCFACRPEEPTANYLVPGAAQAARDHGDGVETALFEALERLHIKEWPG